MKYTTIVRGDITGVIQGDGPQVIIQDGKVIAPRGSFNRLVKCRKCGELVPDSKFCNQCGQPLK